MRRSLQAALDAELFGLWLQVRTKAVSLSQPTATAHGEIHSAAQPGPYLAPYFKADGRLAERLVVAVLARTRAEAMQLFPSLVERLSDDCLRRVTSVTLSSALYPNRRPRGLESRTYAWRELYGIAVADRVDVVGIEKRYQKRGEAFSSRAMELLRDAIADTWIASRTIEILRTVFLAMPTLRDRDITIEQLPEEIDRILRSSFESDGTSDEDPTT